MRLFLDSWALIARYNKDDDDHEFVLEKFQKIIGGEIPVTRMYTSDYVIGEAVTVARVRASHKTAVELGEAVLNSQAIEKLNVDGETFRTAWRIFKKYADKDFSFVDCTSFALMWSKGVQHVFSFDKHFDEVGFVRI